MQQYPVIQTPLCLWHRGFLFPGYPHNHRPTITGGNIMTWDSIMQAIAPALKIMWQGMAGIFVVMAAIALIVYLFTKLVKKK